MAVSITLCGLLLVPGQVLVLAGNASAAGLDLRWDDCAADGGVGDVTLDCANADAIRRLYGSFTSAVSIAASSGEFVLDIQSDAPELPGFWDVIACSHVHVSLDEECSPTCAGSLNPWVTAECGSDTAEPWLFSRTGPNRGRFVIGHRLVTRPIPMDVSFLAFRLHVMSAYAVEAGDVCPGCTTPVVLVLNQATLWAEDGTEVVIVGPGMVSNCATTGGGGTTPCDATPVRNRTWGAIKSLYR